MSDTTKLRELRIGKLSAQFGLNPKTLRYYEELGLLDRPRRSNAGHRLYEVAACDRLRFILKAKAIGLTLAEIGRIVALQRPTGRLGQRSS
jgi:DNA-binding transcriptional MerR regulator